MSLVPCLAPRLPLLGVAVDRRRLSPAEGAWVSWWGTGWAEADPRDARLVEALADDPATMAVCLSQSLPWCRALAERGEALACITVPALRRAVAHVEARGMEAPGMRPPADGGRVREDGLPVRGPTRPTCLVPGDPPPRVWVSGVLAWSLRLWWMREDGDGGVVHVDLTREG